MLPTWRSGLCTVWVSVLERTILSNKWSAYLFITHTAQAYFEHIEIIPAARKSTVDVRRNLVDYGENRTVRTRSDAVRVCGISAPTKVVWSGEGVVDVTRDAP